MRNNWAIRLFAAALCLLLPVTALAAEVTGSLQLVDIDNTVTLYRVADYQGNLTEAFQGAEVKDLTDSLNAVENAKILSAYAAEHAVPGTDELPDENHVVSFPGLELGLYLVRSAAEEAEFDSFLVAIPTMINGEAIYHIEAAPKEEPEEPTDPSEPTGPSEPSEPSEPTGPSEPTEPSKPTDPGPNIPQTGYSVWPKYLLMGFGALAVLLGLVDLIRGREKQA